jgi:hypothetical protein
MNLGNLGNLGKHVQRALGLLAVLVLLASAQQSQDTLTVTRKSTKLREQKRLFAPAVAELHEGDRLGLDRKEGAWLAVTFAQLKGWLHETDVSSKPDVRLSGEGVRESYTASETAAAGKGFNPQVEKTYRGSKPELESAFRLVDRLQARAVSEEGIQAFLIDGGLLKEGL